MNQSNLVTVIIVMAAAVIPYLISQQDVTVPAVVKVALTAVNIALAAYARLSGTTQVPTGKIGSPAATPQGDPAEIARAGTSDGPSS